MGKGNIIDKLGGVGKAIGQELGGGIVHAFGGGKRAESAARNVGGELGAIGLPAAAAALTLKTGGRVPGKKIGAPRMALVHTGEYMLPVGVAPTAAQKKKVAALKAKEKKKK